MNNIIETAAKQLRDALATQTPCPPIRNLIGSDDIRLAYEIQKFNNQIRIDEGARIVGRKIGLTSPAVQQQLGVDQPDYGALLNTMEVLNGTTAPWNELLQPKAEGEIAFVLKKDLTDPTIAAHDLMSSIDYALPSIEIVGSRIANWDIGITDTIADNASASHFVLGHRPTLLTNFDMVGCKMTLWKNEERVSEGLGAACLGSPLNATIWLARKMIDEGAPLRAGDVILTGALGAMTEVAPGDVVRAEFGGLGTVSVSF